MKRTLKRKVIIRETDLQKVKREAFTVIGLSAIYDRAEWHPITRNEIERDMILRGLKDERLPRGGSWQIPENYLLYSRDSLYNQQYIKWRSSYDEQGHMTVQARSNLPRVRLGWAIFEKDLESRL